MNNQGWQKRKEQVFARGMGNLFPIYAARAENAELWDEEGNRYIDFAAGIAVVNTGHSHPDLIGDVRGLGAMIAMELISNGDVQQPNPELAKAVTVKAAEMGLILLFCGVRGNVIRILVPLTIKSKHLEEGLGILEEAFEACI